MPLIPDKSGNGWLLPDPNIPTPGGGSGNVVGPENADPDNIVAFGTSSTIIVDSGVGITDVLLDLGEGSNITIDRTDPQRPVISSSGGGGGGGTVDWDDVDNKPTDYPPSVHTHDWGDITDPPSTYTPSAHTHDWDDVTDKPSSYTPSAHTHDWDDIDNPPLTYAPSAHTHDWDDIDDKPSTFAPSSHTHSYNSLNDLPTLGSAAATAASDYATAAQGTKADTAVQPTRSVTGSDGLTGGGDLSADRSLTIDKATASNIRAGSVNKVVTADGIEAALAPTVSSSITGAIDTDWSSNLSRDLTVIGNITFLNPTNVKAGTTREIWVFGNSATERSISWGTSFKGSLPDVTVTSTRGLHIVMSVRGQTFLSLSWKVIEL